MVLENLSNPWKAEHRPSMLFLWGMLYAIIGGLVASALFPGKYASMVMVALVSGVTIPLLYNTIRYEEQKDLEIPQEQQLLKEHGKAVMVFLMLFLGMTVGMTALYLAMPAEKTVNLFASQIDTYKQINPAAQVSGNATQPGRFQRIFFNNLKVLFFCIIFSFLFGAGAIFVLTWNASVIALAMGNVIRTNLSSLAADAGIVNVGAYLKVAVIDGFSRYFIHGVFEIASYVIAALAGGIISVAIIKKHFTQTEKAEHIILDVSDLLIASFVVLLLGAIIEVYVTPALFNL